jgi:hypothetical protein
MQALLAEENAIDLAAATAQPRSINRRRFTIDEIDEWLADPESNASLSLGHLVEMLRWRTESDAFAPESEQHILTTSRQVVGVERIAGSGESARVYVNVSAEPHMVHTDGFSNLRGFNASEMPGGLELGPYGVAWMTSTPSTTLREP